MINQQLGKRHKPFPPPFPTLLFGSETLSCRSFNEALNKSRSEYILDRDMFHSEGSTVDQIWLNTDSSTKRPRARKPHALYKSESMPDHLTRTPGRKHPTLASPLASGLLKDALVGLQTG